MPYLDYASFPQVLDKFSLEYQNAEFVADKVFKPVKVDTTEASYKVYDKGMFDVQDPTMGKSGMARELVWGWTYQAYKIIYYGLAAKINYVDLANGAAGDDSDEDAYLMAATRTKENMALFKEMQCLGPNSKLRSTSYNGGTVDLSGTPWDTNLTTANPRGVIALGAVEKIRGLTAQKPNTIVMTTRCADVIMATTQWKGERNNNDTYQQFGGSGEYPSKFYGLDAVYCDALYNSANEGQAPVMTKLFGGDVWVGYVKPGQVGKKDFTYSMNFWFRDKFAVFPHPEPEYDTVSYKYDFDPEVVASDYGYIIKGAIATP